MTQKGLNNLEIFLLYRLDHIDNCNIDINPHSHEYDISDEN